MSRRTVATLLAGGLLAASLGMPAAAGKGKGNVHEPPYKKGPQGGDEFNYVHSDPEAGEMGVLRLFPGIPPVVGCAPEPSAGWAMFRVKHHAMGPVRSVMVNYDATLDPYAWVTAGVRNERGDWLGVKKTQGPLTGTGKLKIRLFRQPRLHSTITIEFGLQLGDACPQVGGAVASFPSVKVGG